MKKIIALLTVVFIVSCVNEKTKYGFSNPEQQRFVNLFKGDDLYLANNEIQKEEMKKKFQQKVDSVSSVLMVNNWKGEISEIRNFEIGNGTELSFIISFDIDETNKISFKTSYILDNKQKESDPLYNKVKNMSDFATVYFDGFISTDLLGNTKYFTDDYSSVIYSPNKDFYFNTINISTEITPKFSKNIIKANVISTEVFNLLDQKISKKISNLKWEKETKKLSEQLKDIKLNDDEKAINEIYKKYLYLKFMDL